MFIKELSCRNTLIKCSEKCRYYRPEVLCLNCMDTSYFACDICKKWIDEDLENPVVVGENHYHEKCFKEVGNYAILSSNP